VSVQTYMTKDGPMHRVRWREGGKPRSRSFGSKREANAFDIDVKARRQRGEALPQSGRMTLGAAYAEWWKLRGYRLAKNTQKTYQQHWNAHVKDRYDNYKLSEWVADPSLFDKLLADMDGRGVGPASQRKVLIVISAVFTAAVEWKKVGVNPVLSVVKPSATRSRIPHPFPPMVVERIRLQMRRRRTRDSTGKRRLADAVFVAVMSYAGLRPGEALALTWGDIGQRTIAVDKAVALGEEGPTKTGAVRSAPLVPPLAADLHELWEAQGKPADDQLVLQAASGGYWSQTQYNNWRGRVWRPVMKGLADGDPPQPRLATARPYDCRGSFVSLQLRAGASPLEVARWAGHSPKVMYDHYANVIDELEGEPRLPAAEQIDRAREAVEELQRQELDRLMADLLSQPTVADCEDDDAAAAKFFRPAA
jgi:integrase